MTLDWRDITRQFAEIVGTEYATPKAPQNQLHISPNSLSQISDVVKLAKEVALPIAPVGKQRFPQRVIAKPTVFMSLVRMNQVIQLDEESMLVRVQSGMVGAELEALLQRRGLTLGVFSSGVLRSTIGGMLSVRTAGKSSPRQGFFEDAVLGMSMVLPDGKIIHAKPVPGHSTGPELVRLFCGSFGAYGIIVSAALRISRAGELTLSCGFRFNSLSSGLSACFLALREEAKPEVVEVIRDKQGTRVFMRTSGPSDLASCDRDLFKSAAAAEFGDELSGDDVSAWSTGERRDIPQMVAEVFAKPSALRQAVQMADELLDALPNSFVCRVARLDSRGGVLSLHASERSKILTETVERISSITGVGPSIAEDPVSNYSEALKNALDQDKRLHPPFDASPELRLP